MSKVYLGDVGTDIILDCGSDISDATVRQIIAKKPSGETVTWPAVAEGANSIKYKVVDGDIDEAGLWSLQARVVTPSWSGRGETFPMQVYELFA